MPTIMEKTKQTAAKFEKEPGEKEIAPHGITPWGCIVREKKFLMEHGSFRKHQAYEMIKIITRL